MTGSKTTSGRPRWPCSISFLLFFFLSSSPIVVSSSRRGTFSTRSGLSLRSPEAVPSPGRPPAPPPPPPSLPLDVGGRLRRRSPRRSRAPRPAPYPPLRHRSAMRSRPRPSLPPFPSPRPLYPLPRLSSVVFGERRGQASEASSHATPREPSSPADQVVPEVPIFSPVLPSPSSSSSSFPASPLPSSSFFTFVPLASSSDLGLASSSPSYTFTPVSSPPPSSFAPTTLGPDGRQQASASLLVVRPIPARGTPSERVVPGNELLPSAFSSAADSSAPSASSPSREASASPSSSTASDLDEGQQSSRSPIMLGLGSRRGSPAVPSPIPTTFPFVTSPESPPTSPVSSSSSTRSRGLSSPPSSSSRSSTPGSTSGVPGGASTLPRRDRGRGGRGSPSSWSTSSFSSSGSSSPVPGQLPPFLFLPPPLSPPPAPPLPRVPGAGGRPRDISFAEALQDVGHTPAWVESRESSGRLLVTGGPGFFDPVTFPVLRGLPYQSLRMANPDSPPAQTVPSDPVVAQAHAILPPVLMRHSINERGIPVLPRTTPIYVTATERTASLAFDRAVPSVGPPSRAPPSPPPSPSHIIPPYLED